jgi:hypothetical protein
MPGGFGVHLELPHLDHPHGHARGSPGRGAQITRAPRLYAPRRSLEAASVEGGMLGLRRPPSARLPARLPMDSMWGWVSPGDAELLAGRKRRSQAKRLERRGRDSHPRTTKPPLTDFETATRMAQTDCPLHAPSYRRKKCSPRETATGGGYLQPSAKPCTAVQIRSSPSLIAKPKPPITGGFWLPGCMARCITSIRERHTKSECCRAGCRTSRGENRATLPRSGISGGMSYISRMRPDPWFHRYSRSCRTASTLARASAIKRATLLRPYTSQPGRPSQAPPSTTRPARREEGPVFRLAPPRRPSDWWVAGGSSACLCPRGRAA